MPEKMLERNWKSRRSMKLGARRNEWTKLDTSLRLFIYRHVIAKCRAPSIAEMAKRFKSRKQVGAARVGRPPYLRQQLVQHLRGTRGYREEFQRGNGLRHAYRRPANHLPVQLHAASTRPKHSRTGPGWICGPRSQHRRKTDLQRVDTEYPRSL